MCCVPRRSPLSTLFPYTTLFRSRVELLAPDGTAYLLQAPSSDTGDDIHTTYEVDLSREARRSEEHTSELQSPCNIVCRLLLEKANASRSYPKSLLHNWMAQ